jgi:hypothetical protein
VLRGFTRARRLDDLVRHLSSSAALVRVVQPD